MNKKYLVIVKHNFEFHEIQEKLYTKEEILEKFYGTFLKNDDDYYEKVRSVEEGIKMLKEELFEFYTLEEVLEDYGSLEKWEEEVIKNISHMLDPRLKIYEVCEDNSLKQIKPEELL